MPDTGHYPTIDPTELAARYSLIRERFYDTAETVAVERSTGTIFVNAIAAPVFDHGNEIVGAIGVLTGLPGEEAVTAEEIKVPLFECCAQISQALGATRWSQREAGA